MNDDLISRQAVIDILEREGHKWGNDYRDWVDAVNKVETLPSVNPQEPKTDVLDKIIDEVCDIDDKIVLNPDSLFERKAYVRFNKVIDIIDKYRAESEG